MSQLWHGTSLSRVVCASRVDGRLKAGLHEDVQSQREHSILIDGLWLSAPLTLFALDLIYPLVTRTTAQFFTCRDLETPHDGDPHNDDGVPSGWWLEADYRPVTILSRIF